MGRALMKPTKTEIARTLGVSRQSLYYVPKREEIDQEVKHQIEAVLVQNPGYGHKRIALHLKMNKKRVLRVMHKYAIHPYRKSAKKREKKKDKGQAPMGIPNLIAKECPIRPNVIWVSDFTYIKFQQKFIYLATQEDLFTREIVGKSVSRFHTRFLVMESLQDALQASIPPRIAHDDQGSEYRSDEYQSLLAKYGILPSMSAKGSPWQNGYQESFYSRFKEDFGDPNRYESLPELIEAIYLHIYYYNHQRIHSALKMPPVKFRDLYLERLSKIQST